MSATSVLPASASPYNDNSRSKYPRSNIEAQYTADSGDSNAATNDTQSEESEEGNASNITTIVMSGTTEAPKVPLHTTESESASGPLTPSQQQPQSSTVAIIMVQDDEGDNKDNNKDNNKDTNKDNNKDTNKDNKDNQNHHLIEQLRLQVQESKQQREVIMEGHSSRSSEGQKQMAAAAPPSESASNDDDDDDPIVFRVKQDKDESTTIATTKVTSAETNTANKTNRRPNDDDKPSTVAKQLKQLQQEKETMESQLKQALQTADTLRTKLTRHRRSVTQDQLILEELKGERNQLRDEVALYQRKSSHQRESSKLSVVPPSSLSSSLLLDDDGFLIVDTTATATATATTTTNTNTINTITANGITANSKTDEKLATPLTEKPKREHENSNSPSKPPTIQRSSSSSSTFVPMGDTALIIQQLKEERDRLRSQLDEAHFQMKEAKAVYQTTSMEDKRIIQELKEERMTLRDHKLNELRAHKKSVESHLKRMVSPHYPKSMIGNLRKELSTNQQIIQEQRMLLGQSQSKQKSHERIIAEQKIQLRLLANKMKEGFDNNKSQTRLFFRNMWTTTSRNDNLGTTNNIAAAAAAASPPRAARASSASSASSSSLSPTEQRLDRWKDRFQKDIEETFDALLEKYSRQLDYVDKEYDVRTYQYKAPKNKNRLLHLPNMMIDGGGSGLFFWVKVLFIVLLWTFHY
ncbi:MAG: hypothetical protein SGBAC_012510 [Bacillariaceae sp.]